MKEALVTVVTAVERHFTGKIASQSTQDLSTLERENSHVKPVGRSLSTITNWNGTSKHTQF